MSFPVLWSIVPGKYVKVVCGGCGCDCFVKMESLMNEQNPVALSLYTCLEIMPDDLMS
jgi:hypothetical protein